MCAYRLREITSRAALILTKALVLCAQTWSMHLLYDIVEKNPLEINISVYWKEPLLYFLRHENTVFYCSAVSGWLPLYVFVAHAKWKLYLFPSGFLYLPVSRRVSVRVKSNFVFAGYFLWLQAVVYPSRGLLVSKKKVSYIKRYPARLLSAWKPIFCGISS